MVRIRESTVIDAPVDEVWHILRDFNGHDRWHPAVAASEIEAGPVDRVGAVRHFRLAEGGELREQLLSLSDEERTFSYCILEAPFPLMGYVATVRLRPVTDGARTFWEWSSTFDPPPSRREELTALVRDGIYRSGFRAIRKVFDQSEQPPLRLAALGASPERGEEGRRRAWLPSSPPRSGGEVSREARRRGGDEELRPSTAKPQARFSTTGTDTTRAILVERYGGPEVLEWREIALPPPAPGEVQIRHTAIGVNFIDVYCRTGYFDLLKLPGVPGMEAAGVVEQVGEGVSGLAPGDRVAYACPPVGAYAERRNIAPDLLVRLPPDIADETAAAGLLKGVTASFLLHDVHAVRPGETVLVHAAAGGVGQLLVQWARHLGAIVVATVSSDEKAEIARSVGAAHVVVYTRENFAEAVARLTGGHGADVAYDAVGADSFARTLEALAPRGHLVSFGQASGPVGSWDIGRFASKSITISRPNYGHYTDTPERLAPHVERFFSALRGGIVRLAPPRRYPLARAAEAHRDLETRRTTGSLVLLP